MLIVPEALNRNGPRVRAMGSPAETGAWLIDYMCHRLGLPDLGQSRVLDMGCGTRFAQSFINLRLPLGSYFGVDVSKEVIDHLASSVSDPRFTFAWWNVQNHAYNPGGVPLILADAEAPFDGRIFDLACMFSVITHQVPQDAERLLSIIRNRMSPTGCLFFTANIHQHDADYIELVPDQPTGHSAYSMLAMERILASSGWSIVSAEPGRPRNLPIQASFVCAPN